MTHKFDIFSILNEIKNNNKSFYDNLGEEEKKSISPYVLMLWCRGINTNPALHTILLNEYVNPFVFSLQKHPSLVWRLLCEASYDEKSTRFAWIKKGSKKGNCPTSTKLIMTHYVYNENHAQDVLTLLDLNDILCIAEDYGYEKAETDKLKKEYADRG